MNKVNKNEKKGDNSQKNKNEESGISKIPDSQTETISGGADADLNNNVSVVESLSMLTCTHKNFFTRKICGLRLNAIKTSENKKGIYNWTTKYICPKHGEQGSSVGEGDRLAPKLNS